MKKKYLYYVLYTSNKVFNYENLKNGIYILATDLCNLHRILYENKDDVMTIDTVELVSKHILY